MSEVESRLASIEKDLTYIRDFIESDREAYKEHLKTAENYRSRVTILEERDKGHSREHIYYRWLFGIIISVGIALLTK